MMFMKSTAPCGGDKSLKGQLKVTPIKFVRTDPDQ
jgi:hypothetical protein